MLRSWTMAVSTLLMCLPQAGLAETLPGVEQRFRPADVTEVPDFQKHVVPLLGKLGCNGRACHGSFQGQGGFRLSLFGYDFKMDHDGLTSGDEPRVLPDDPDRSLAIQKPTMQIPHEGGERFELGSWEHHVLRQWIQAGAGNRGNPELQLERLEVTPDEILFAKAEQTVPLSVIAVWSDGTREEVTALSRFQSNNSAVAMIDRQGVVTAGTRGDTHVVVFFDTGVVPIPVIRPMSDLAGAAFPDVPTPTPIDTAVVNKLRKLGIVPSSLCSDAEFLRRVRLDLTGTLPTSNEALRFIEDTSADKRAKKINELLDSPDYAAWWTTRLCDLTGNNDRELNNLVPTNNRTAVSQAWYDWLYQRVQQNVGYDEIMEGIILGRSRDRGEDFTSFSTSMSEICQDREMSGFSDRDFMPFFWARNQLRRSSEARAIAFAYTFMGIRIQCAQCHKHPFDQWTQDDFKQFTGFFAGVTFGQNPESRSEYSEMIEELGVNDLRGNDQRRKLASLLKDGKTIPFQEVFVRRPLPQSNRKPQTRRNRSNNAVPATARLLGGQTVALADYDDAREPLMEWLKQRNNRFFSRAFVNRVWANYFNVGIVEPPDDMSLANPPGNRELLDYLAAGFSEHDFDMKWLHREILNSRTYQMSWQPTDSNRADLTNFSHAIPRRMEAEVAYDAIRMATSSDSAVTKLLSDRSERAIAFAPTVTRNNSSMGYALQVFGRSTRESNCDCDRSSESSLLQTVFLQNDQDVLNMIDARDGWLAQVTPWTGNPRGGSVDARNRRRQQFQEAQGRLKKKLQQAAKVNDQKRIAALRQRLVSLKDLYTSGQPFPEKLEEATEENANSKELVSSASSKEVGNLIVGAYLRTLGRHPTEAELSRSRAFVQDADDLASGIRGILWALLNTKEFIVNH